MRSTPPDRLSSTDAENCTDDLLIRPATASDIEDFYELARLAGAGFTSLPANEAVLAERLLSSERAFAGEPGVLMLALEDTAKKRVVGCAAVKPGGRARENFLNFRIDDDRRSLTPTARYADMTEVGSLLLHPDYRRGGIGPWLSRSRYLLIATDQDRFGSHIFSELRGVVDEEDRSPFYDAVCAPYFGCSFAEADNLSAHGRQGELNALLPELPIALNGLDAKARDAMAQPHRAGRRALDFLREDGFRFEGVVDLLDGGPAVVAPSRAVRTIKESFEAPLRSTAADGEIALTAYVAVGSGPDFRCFRTDVSIQKDGSIRCALGDDVDTKDGGGLVGRVHLVDEARTSHPRLKPPASKVKAQGQPELVAEPSARRSKSVTS